MLVVAVKRGDCEEVDVLCRVRVTGMLEAGDEVYRVLWNVREIFDMIFGSL